MKYITAEGLEKLKEELKDRKTKVRREIASAIKEAKELGDLSENAEYSEARRQQRENEARIMELENTIRTSSVISNRKNGASKVVKIGSVVEFEVKKEKKVFEIVGQSEADPEKGRVSNESPIGQALLGRKKGEEFKVTLPNGKKVDYKIISIK